MAKKFFSKGNLLYCLYLFIVTFLLLEIALRIYNPFHFRIKGDHILLQANKTFVVYNTEIPVLDKKIVHTKNNLGFRGPEKPDSLEKYLSIVSIGGSTTECQYLGDGKTWSDHLYQRLHTVFEPVWLNNAGIAGHSTFGHIAMLQDHISKLKPKLALFLIGANDIGRDDLTESDKSSMQGHYANFFTFLSKNSEVCNVITNLIRTRRAVTKQLNDHYIDIKAGMYDTLVLPGKFIENSLNLQKPYLPSYEKRLKTIAALCRQNNILPVFITQPSLFGVATDSVTGAHLGVFKLAADQNGKLWWGLQELYNDVTRKVAGEEQLHLVDLAYLMPKNSYYFYDMVHFTNAGSQKVADILFDDLNHYLAQKFPQYLKR
jgi:lysophospholipase L1-like esterase